MPSHPTHQFDERKSHAILDAYRPYIRPLAVAPLLDILSGASLWGFSISFSSPIRPMVGLSPGSVLRGMAALGLLPFGGGSRMKQDEAVQHDPRIMSSMGFAVAGKEALPCT